ncbi:MAG: mechanosensitive ion channel family protein, partial [Desulfovibrio sp.]|nr:mechanosensitive ion channel family protein [Desulfovibrio sp.]
IIKRNILKYAQKKQIVEKNYDSSSQPGKIIPRINVTDFNKLMRSAMALVTLLICGWGLRQLVIGPIYNTAVDVIFTTICTVAAIRFLTILARFYMDTYLRGKGRDLANSQERSLLPIINGIIWAVGATFLLDNLGFKVSTIIAGLGIVGVAVGMAGQTIIKDFFGYLVILLDKPFVIGDFIILSTGKSGNVIYVGPKNTRLMSLEGDLIVCPNAEITSATLTNQGDIAEREVEIVLGVAYATPMETVRKFPDIIKEVVNSFPQCRYERCCMTSFGTANYLFQLIYKVREEGGGLNAFMTTQMEVNLAIQERENQEKIAGAYPTQTILLTDMTPEKQ